jgi:hypothetical protein
VSVNALPEAGRYNVRSSFDRWLRTKALPASPISQGSLTTALAYTLQFEKPIAVADLNAGKVVICAEDLGAVPPEVLDTDDLTSVDPDGSERYAKREGLLIELSVWCSSGVVDDADARILRVVDVLKQALYDCGRKTAGGAYVVDPMTVYDYATGPLAAPPATNQLIHKDRTTGVVIEAHPGDAQHPEWRAWTIQVRLWWFGFFAG